MQWIDIIILLLIGIPAFMGMKVGIIKAVLSLVGIIIGVILAGRFHVALSENLPFNSSAEWANIAAFAIILIGVMIIAAVLASLLKMVVSAILLGWVNRLGGAVFGLLLGAVFCGAILAIWAKFLGAGGPLSGSVIAPVLLDRFPLVLAFLPEEFDAIRGFFQ